ncbi:MAG TPA: hypothetical protein VKY19_16880 [Ktedonosporobacter sp.]|jgi:hypothetical protein|nr:hypothetical protein [Ktedonosporobacter sp.]
MPGKNACIVIDLRTGQHLVKIPDIVAVLAAASWKVDVSLKEYGGETLKLAQKAALAIVNSQIHKIDLGHMEVQSPTPLKTNKPNGLAPRMSLEQNT